MVIFNEILNEKEIYLKKKLQYSEDFSFIPIFYKKQDILIQTPLLLNNGIKNIYNKDYVSLSFINHINDKNILILVNFLNDIHNIIINKYKNTYNIDNILKEFNGHKFLSCKLHSDTLFFDNQKNKISAFQTNKYGEYLIYLHGLWIHDSKIYYDWYIVQCKFPLPLYLNEYAFFDKDSKKSLPPRPPPPPPPLPIFKKTTTKIKLVKKIKKSTSNDINFDPPSIDDLKKALVGLKKI